MHDTEEFWTCRHHRGTLLGSNRAVGSTLPDPIRAIAGYYGVVLQSFGSLVTPVRAPQAAPGQAHGSGGVDPVFLGPYSGWSHLKVVCQRSLL